MKNGRTLVELATEIQRQFESKKDFLVPTKKIQAYAANDLLELGFGIGEGDEHYASTLTENGHNQLGSFCGIPAKYYDLMRAVHPLNC